MTSIISALLKGAVSKNAAEDDALLKLVIVICPIWLLGLAALLIIAALFFGSTAEANAELDFCGIYPLPCDTYRVSSDYGTRVHPITDETKKHTGIDFTPEWHSSVYTIADGVVYDVSVNAAFGNCITIEHSTEYGTFYSFYAHLSKVKVAEGDEVVQGEVIALEGGDPYLDKNAGLSTGHHLHFEIRLEPQYGSDVNPKLYLKKEAETDDNQTGDMPVGRADGT